MTGISSTLLRHLLGTNANYQPLVDRTTHTLIIGKSGVGKSWGIESWAMQDVTAGRGVGTVTPHGELHHNLLFRLAAHPEVWERLVIIDPCQPDWTVCFNPLATIRGFSQERLALFLTDVVVNIWNMSASEAPRAVWLLTNTFLALSSLGLTLVDLPRFLLDRDFRESLLPRVISPSVHDYFCLEFPTSPGAAHQWVTPVLNKIEPLIYDADIRLMLGGRPTIDFQKIMDRQLILLVNLPRGIIGEGLSALLGAFMVAHLQKAALAREESRNRPPFYLYLDEFQNYTTSNIKDMLTESRKYRLSLTLVHQYLDQLSPDIRSAVLSTTGTINCFRVGFSDASILAKEIFPSPDFLTTRQKKYKVRRIGMLPLPTVEESQEPLGWDGLALELTHLPNRYFWVRQQGRIIPSLMRTVEMPDPSYTEALWAARREMLAVAGERYGRPKREVQRELEARISRPAPRSNGHGPAPETDGEATIPFWGS